MKNYYGSLCTEMYEILHESAPGDELNFYLSYAEKGMSILEPLCGSGRFLIPFLERGFENLWSRFVRRDACETKKEGASS